MDAGERRLDAQIAAELERDGVAVVADYCPRSLWHALAADARERRSRGEFRAAGVGRGAAHRVLPDVRGDELCWIDPIHPSPPQRLWLERMDRLRLALNRGLFLGLFDLESHYAVYPPGACYAAHVDRFRDAPRRTISTLLYLNEDWRTEHGGALRLHMDRSEGTTAPPILTGESDSEQQRSETSWQDVVPSGGTFVAFLSAELLHEVLPASRERWSIAGWFAARP